MYDGSITDLKPPSGTRPSDLSSGDLGVVFDKNRRFVAIGLYDPDSPIRLRILHQGSPLTIDGAFWRDRLATALERRQPLLADGQHTGWRWVSGENDQLPGLVLDCYDRTLVVKLDAGAWLPHLDPLLSEAVALRDVDTIVLRLSRTVSVLAFGAGSLSDGDILAGAAPAAVTDFRENGLALTADVVQGQKTGYFLDQRANRRRVGELSAGHDVLDMFSCTGGFTVAALAKGARSVHADCGRPHAIEAVRRHAGLLDAKGSLTTSVNDAFAELEQLNAAGRSFGVVVVDPPSFATSAKDVAGARKAYRRLTELAVPLVAPGGWLVQASCTARVSADDFVDGVLAEIRLAARAILDDELTGHDVDHPVGFPEGAYLKCLFARLA